MEEAEALPQVVTTKVALNGADIMEFFSSVPLVDGKNCPDNEDHNRLASQANKRLTRSGPDCVWRIFYYADSIFTGMRNTATPSQPLGVNPAEDEWWKIYMAIEDISKALGSLPPELSKLRMKMDKDLFKQSYRTYSDHDVIVGVF